MRRSVLAAVLYLSFLGCLAAAQEEQPYFSLSSEKTYGPGDKITMRLYAREVDALEFRMYRVNDPEVFFSKMDNIHSFGMRSYSPVENIDEKPAIEKYHDWKRGTWIRLRNFFRGQFSSESRVALREKRAQQAKKTKVSGAAGFAQVPLLNEQQLVARWRQDLPPSFSSETLNVPIDAPKSGVYVIEVTDGSLKAYGVIIVSDIALVTKTGGGQVLAFAVERKSGAPVVGIPVMLHANKKKIAEGRTDKDGLWQGKAFEEKIEGSSWVLARRGDDVGVVSTYSYYFSSDQRQDLIGYVYTDRPVYRPGHTMRFKAILRRRDGDKLQVPAGLRANVLVEGPDEKKLLQKDFTVSANGSLHGEVEVPADVPLGYYSISVNLPDRGYVANGGFHIEEYKKPEYMVKVTTEQPRVLQGSSMKATFEARYYFGEPVANAKVKYVVHTQRYWAPYWERDDEERSGEEGGGEEDGGGYYYGGEEQSEQEGKLDENGKLTVEIPTAFDVKRNWDVTYRVEARVMDAANREISGVGTFLATYGSFMVNIRSENYSFKFGERPRFTVEAKNYDGKPVQTSVRVSAIRYAYGRGRERDEEVGSVQTQTGADGRAVFEMPISGAGSLTIRATARTPEGRDVQDSTWVWMQGQGDRWWSDNHRQIQVIPDKKKYKVGETARITIVTGIEEAHVLVTSEGRALQSKQVMRATGGTTSIEVPITSASVPNFYVSAVFVNSGNLYQGSKSVKVPADAQRLNIEVIPAKQTFQPGEKGSYELIAKDADGKPVAGEFSVGVVDDAIYAVRSDSSGDIVSAFYPNVYQMFGTDSSLNFYFHGEAGTRSMQLAQNRSALSRSLAQVKPQPEALVQPKVRKAFPDTAYWSAEVRTGADGRARVNLEFPDSLTTWRATVRGITADSKAGQSVNRVIVRKNVMVRIAAPRFFRQGDESTVSVIVHNYLQNAKTAKVSLDVRGLDVIGGATQDVSLPSRGEARVDWRVKANKIGEAVFLAKALTNEESDAMEMTYPVKAFGVRQAIPRAGTISEQSGNRKVEIAFPKQSDPASRGLTIIMTPSVAGTVFNALEYLTAYPYGCVEQTMSSFVPNVVVAQAARELKIKADLQSAELPKKIRAGLDRLYDFQHEDGGWGWWKEDDSATFMTAYVVNGLSQAKEAGVEVNDEAIQRGRDWLLKKLEAHPNMIADLRAYVVYSLVVSGHRDKAMLDTLWSRKDKMSAHGLALAGLAAHISGDGRGTEAAEELEKLAKQDEGEAYWQTNFDGLMEIYGDTSAETTAYAIKLISRSKPQSALLPKAAMWLASHRSEGYYWNSTKQTAMVIYGLIDYLKVSKELEANFTAEVLVNGRPVGSKRFTVADAFSDKPPVFHLKPEELEETNSIEVRKSGNGRLYWSASGAYYSTDQRMYQSGSLKLNISRDYFKLVPVRKDNRITYDLKPLDTAMKPGDVIAVRLHVSGDNWKYVLIEDPIPAGTEFLQRDHLYEINDRPGWWGYYYTRREYHDDRAAMFQTEFGGQRDYFYMLKVVNPGKFRVSPALVQPMYQPNVLATTDSANVEVQQ